MLARVSRSLPHLASSIAFTALHVKRWPPSLASAASAVVAGDPVGVGCLAHSSFNFSVLGEFEFSSSQVSFSCFFRRWRTTEKQEPKLAHSICRLFNCAKKRLFTRVYKNQVDSVMGLFTTTVKKPAKAWILCTPHPHLPWRMPSCAEEAPPRQTIKKEKDLRICKQSRGYGNI